MKKLILPILILLIFGSTLWYFTSNKKTPVNPDNATYKNSSLSLSFSYPKILTASTTLTSVTLHHEVPFTHHDYCDFRGESTTTIPTLTDFNVVFHVSSKNLASTMHIESPYIPEENFVNGEVVPSPGFIDVFQVGDLKGFKIFEGAEGCGQTKYYISISKTKTLVIIESWITVFSGAIDAENQTAAEAVPGVINKQKSEEILNSILETLKEQ